MTKLSDREKEFLIEKLQKGEQLPDDFKYKLFPTNQKEYELVYAGKMRKEDILADEDGVTAAPLQIERTYNGERESYPDGWKNMIVFGDNLQFLKTIYKNEDPLIKDKVKGKVKLIYIDPPFATESDFSGSQGQKAYTDKTKDADFIEFLRRRLIVAREILAPDGVIFVHLDWKKAHYVKVILDEIFGERNFKNNITWHYGGRMMHHLKQFNRKHEIILFYTKMKDNYTFNMPNDEVDFDEYAKSRHEKIHIAKDGRRYLLAPDANMERTTKQYEEDIVAKGRAVDDVWEIRYIRGNAKERTGYPTQKPEALIQRIIESTTDKGDLVFDFFGGSGTTAAVAEKLNRKWITCDIGKYSFYVIQKRLLTINESKSLIDKKKSYSERLRCFTTFNTGLYDIERLFKLQRQDYQDFVLNLFEVSPKLKKIAGIEFQGERKDGYDVMIWKYWEHKDAAVDEDYLEILHKNIGKKVGDRIYIIAPANSVQFIDDYYEIGNVRYYFLKVPYQIIQELHKEKFKKFRQPTSSSNVNSLENAVGFHFIRQPEVKSSFQNGVITIQDFKAYYPDEDTLEDIPGLDALAMVVIDKNYNGNEFLMSDVFFASDIIGDDGQANISLENCGPKISAVYIDIYGNEFREVFTNKIANG
ncbi:MAG: site-specific DNA-methyltransferase [Flavobacteriales bacterium]|nr:site-specific DNA-methyltransferase [Flavobacteriales bacterium]